MLVIQSAGAGARPRHVDELRAVGGEGGHEDGIGGEAGGGDRRAVGRPEHAAEGRAADGLAELRRELILDDVSAVGRDGGVRPLHVLPTVPARPSPDAAERVNRLPGRQRVRPTEAAAAADERGAVRGDGVARHEARARRVHRRVVQRRRVREVVGGGGARLDAHDAADVLRPVVDGAAHRRGGDGPGVIGEDGGVRAIPAGHGEVRRAARRVDQALPGGRVEGEAPLWPGGERERLELEGRARHVDVDGVAPAAAVPHEERRREPAWKDGAVVGVGPRRVRIFRRRAGQRGGAGRAHRARAPYVEQQLHRDLRARRHSAERRCDGHDAADGPARRVVTARVDRADLRKAGRPRDGRRDGAGRPVRVVGGHGHPLLHGSAVDRLDRRTGRADGDRRDGGDAERDPAVPGERRRDSPRRRRSGPGVAASAEKAAGPPPAPPLPEPPAPAAASVRAKQTCAARKEMSAIVDSSAERPAPRRASLQHTVGHVVRSRESAIFQWNVSLGRSTFGSRGIQGRSPSPSPSPSLSTFAFTSPSPFAFRVRVPRPRSIPILPGPPGKIG